MDIYLSINNRAEVIKLPVLPSQYKIKSPMKNETFTTISQGDIKLIGLKGLKALEFQSFFPSVDYPFTKNSSYSAWEYIDKLEEWRDNRIPIRLVITDTNINMPVTIDDFNYGEEDGSGDIYYSLTLSEFKFINLQTKGVS